MKRLALVVTFALTCLASAGVAHAKEVKVSISSLKFNPASVQISAGDTVVWTNDDDRGHTIVADDDSFSSGEIGIGNTFRQTFKAAGEVAYHCDHHPRMRGRVNVKAKDSGGKEPKGKDPKEKK